MIYSSTNNKNIFKQCIFTLIYFTDLLEGGGVLPVEVAHQLPVVQVALENHQGGLGAQLLVQLGGVVLHFVEGSAQRVEADELLVAFHPHLTTVEPDNYKTSVIIFYQFTRLNVSN